MRAILKNRFTRLKTYISIKRYIKTKFENLLTIFLVVSGIIKIGEIEYAAIQREKNLIRQIADCYKQVEDITELQIKIASLEQRLSDTDSILKNKDEELSIYRKILINNALKQNTKPKK